jgi:signal transduction histidine kinase
MSKQYDLQIKFSVQDVPKKLPKDISLCLFRVAQEALHNAMKYSGVRDFTVELTATDNTVKLVLSDKGAGFDVQKAGTKGGLGLLSMHERVNLVHGTLSVDSVPGEGTSIQVTVPLGAAERRYSEDHSSPKVGQGLNKTR